jgi:hypothetical protein
MHPLDLVDVVDDFLNTKKYNNNPTATTTTKTPPAINIFGDDVSVLMFTSGTLIYLNLIFFSI